MMAVPPVHALESPNPKIPLASTPHFLNTTFPFILTVVSALWLLVLLILDVYRSWRNKNGHFIPGKHLILGALSLQLLGVVVSPIASISSDERTLDPAVVMELSATIHKKRVLIVAGRVVMCVLIGIMLPHAASSGAKNRRSDMLALLISAVGVLFHISYEDYITEAKHLTHDVYDMLIQWIFFNATDLLTVTDLIISYSITFLIFLLAFAALISNSVRKDVAHRIPVMMSPVECGNTAGLTVSWEEAEEKLVQSWITARTSQIQYIIARSTLTSSTCFIVTLCVVFFILESYHKNLYAAVQSSPLLWIVIISQWSFILMGWAIVSWRCIIAVVYNPRRTGLWAFFRSEASYQGRRVYDGLLELLHEQRLSCLKHAFKCLLQEYPKSFKKRALKTALVDVLVYPALSFSIICWLILESVFSNRYIRKLVMRRDYVEISELDHDADFIKYRRNLMDMPTENLEGLWIANLKSIAMAKAWFRKGEAESHQCTALISLLTKNNSHGLSYVRDPFSFSSDIGFPKRTPKMMAVTLLTVIIELSPFYGSPNANTVVRNCIDACYDAWKIMGFVERKDQEADIIFDDLKKWYRWLGVTLPMNKFKDRTMEKAKTALVELAKQGADHMHLKEPTIYDPLNWKASIAVHNLWKVYESIRDCSVDNLEEMLAVIQSSLADVIRACVLKVDDTIMKDCRLEAEVDMEEEEDKLWNVLYVAGIAKGITMLLDGPAAEAHTRSLDGRPHSSVDMSRGPFCKDIRAKCVKWQLNARKMRERVD